MKLVGLGVLSCWYFFSSFKSYIQVYIERLFKSTQQIDPHTHVISTVLVDSENFTLDNFSES